MRSYITNKGDSFESIAYSVYGDETKADLIMQANQQYLEICIFDYGIRLIIPDDDSISVSSSIPPWR